MTFNNLHNGTSCNCIDSECVINTEEVFCRKLVDQNIQVSDFNSYWENGQQNKNKTDCAKTCLLKGVSLQKFIDDNTIESKYKTTKTFKPAAIQYKYYCKIKFRKNAGKIKPTPGRDLDHHTFYKADSFSINEIDVLEIKPIQ